MSHRLEDPALLRALLSAAVDAIVVSDGDGTIIRSNEAAARMFGHPIEKLTGQNVRTLMPADMASQHDGFMQHHIGTGDKRIIGIGRDVDGLRADGTVFPLHLSVGRADLDGDIAFVAIMHDLSRRQAAEQAAARTQRMDAIGQMTGGIAHDFNNLLTVVIGNLELLEASADTPKTAQVRALIGDALDAAQLGADLTSRLMVFARQSALRPEVIALNDAAAQSLAMVKRTLGPQITISADLAPDLWAVRADATQLKTAILNLALNAKDAMPKGGRMILDTRNVVLDDDYIAQEIGVTPGRYVRLSISDTGTGMSADTRARALEPFFTTKATGRGTGLGLSMVFGFIKQSDGHLTIYSEPGEGTTVSLYFPVSDATQRADTDAAPPTDPDQIGLGKTVLLVEDDARVRRLSLARLAALGFRCLEATTADDGWALLKGRDDIDLVFSDLVMPGTMSGHDLAQRIAAEKPQIRVLLTSGFSEGVLGGGRIGAEFPILRKPHRQADLIRALQAIFSDD